MNGNVFPTSSGGAEEKLKSYWNRPGGKFGTIAALLGLGAIGYYVLPILTQVVWNTVNFGIALVCLGLLWYALSHKKLRMGLFYFYEILMKKFIGIVIQMDPFIIAEDYIRDMEKERENLSEQIQAVSGQKETLNMKIKEKMADMDKTVNKMKAAEKVQDNMQVSLMSREITRLKNYIEKLNPIKNNLAIIEDHLTKVHKNSAYMIQDMRSELAMNKDLYNSVTKGNKALKSAMRIFQGDPEKKLLLEQSTEFFKEDIGNKLASMKQAMSVTTDFMKSIDLENATYEIEGLKMLEELNMKEFQYKLNQSPIDNKIVITPGVPQTNNYNNLLD